jgi:NADPH:quinone reductase
LKLHAFDGRRVLIASHLGERADINVRQIVRRRLTLTGSTIRPRPPDCKGQIPQVLVKQVWPLLEDGRMRLDVCATFPLAEVSRAHAMLDGNEQLGKVVLIVACDGYRTAIFSPSSSPATNFSRSSIGLHSCQGILHSLQKA